MAPANTFHGEPAPLQRSVPGDSLYGVTAAGGGVAARRGIERRDAQAVEPDGENQQEGEYFSETFCKHRRVARSIWE